MRGLVGRGNRRSPMCLYWRAGYAYVMMSSQITQAAGMISRGKGRDAVQSSYLFHWKIHGTS
jgi:hypothetical protein